MEDRGGGVVEDGVRRRWDVGAGHQHVGGVGEVRDGRGVGHTLRMVGLVVVIGQVVEDVTRVLGGGQTLGVGVLPCQIVGHLRLVGGG